LKCIGLTFSLLSSAAATYQINGWLKTQLNIWLSDVLNQRGFVYYGILGLKLLLVGAVLFGLAWRLNKTIRIVQSFFLILAPLFFVYAAQGLWAYAFVDLYRVGTGKASAPFLAQSENTRRAVWIVFDELDERLLFDRRPDRIQTPEFDRFRSEAVSADHAIPPARETLLSMPSFLLGESIKKVELDTSQLLFEDGNGASLNNFAKQENIFRRVRAAGFNTAVAGWYLPYCRLIGSDVSDCAWASLGPAVVCAERLIHRRAFLDKLAFMVRWQARLTFPDLVASRVMDATPDDLLGRRLQNIRAMELVMQNGIRMLRNPKLNFILLHVPAPHPPGFWNSRLHRFVVADADYLDNYELADEVLGRFRKTLEGLGAWDNTTVLVTSDHSYRTGLWIEQGVWNAETATVSGSRQYPYVPFLLKLPSQRTPYGYRREFNNRVSGDLLLKILAGNINTPQEATGWMDQQVEIQKLAGTN
jgi:hypothetical protein